MELIRNLRSIPPEPARAARTHKKGRHLRNRQGRFYFGTGECSRESKIPQQGNHPARWLFDP
jgi:hypothetical protein